MIPMPCHHSRPWTSFVSTNLNFKLLRRSTYPLAVGLQALMDRGMSNTTAPTNRGPQPAQGSPAVSSPFGPSQGILLTVSHRHHDSLSRSLLRAVEAGQSASEDQIRLGPHRGETAVATYRLLQSKLSANSSPNLFTWGADSLDHAQVAMVTAVETESLAR